MEHFELIKRHNCTSRSEATGRRSFIGGPKIPLNGPKSGKNHLFLALIYGRFSTSAYPQRILLFESKMRILSHEVLMKNKKLLYF